MMMDSRIVRKSLPLEDGESLHYSFFNAIDNEIKAKPLLLCLHPGWSGRLPDTHYGERFLESLFIPAFGHIGAFMVAPDCPAEAWNNEYSVGALSQLVQHLKKSAAIDNERISIIGYSAGGFGVWYLLQSGIINLKSAVIVAATPVLGGVQKSDENLAKSESGLSTGREQWLSGLLEIPILMIHGEDDEVMPIEKTEQAYSILASDGRDVEFVSIKGVGHFETEKYVEALRLQANWLRQTWAWPKN